MAEKQRKRWTMNCIAWSDGVAFALLYDRPVLPALRGVHNHRWYWVSSRVGSCFLLHMSGNERAMNAARSWKTTHRMTTFLQTHGYYTPPVFRYTDQMAWICSRITLYSWILSISALTADQPLTVSIIILSWSSELWLLWLTKKVFLPLFVTDNINRKFQVRFPISFEFMIFRSYPTGTYG